MTTVWTTIQITYTVMSYPRASMFLSHSGRVDVELRPGGARTFGEQS